MQMQMQKKKTGNVRGERRRTLWAAPVCRRCLPLGSDTNARRTRWAGRWLGTTGLADRSVDPFEPLGVQVAGHDRAAWRRARRLYDRSCELVRFGVRRRGTLPPTLALTLTPAHTLALVLALTPALTLALALGLTPALTLALVLGLTPATTLPTLTLTPTPVLGPGDVRRNGGPPRSPGPPASPLPRRGRVAPLPRRPKAPPDQAQPHDIVGPKGQG